MPQGKRSPCMALLHRDASTDFTWSCMVFGFAIGTLVAAFAPIRMLARPQLSCSSTQHVLEAIRGALLLGGSLRLGTSRRLEFFGCLGTSENSPPPPGAERRRYYCNALSASHTLVSQHPWPCVTFTLLVVVNTSPPGVFVMTAYRALIRPSGEDAMGRSCILDSHPGRWMPAAVVRMPACHSRRFKGGRPIGAATG